MATIAVQAAATPAAIAAASVCGAHPPVMSASASSSSKRGVDPAAALDRQVERGQAHDRPAELGRLEPARLRHQLLRREGLQPQLAGDVRLGGAGLDQHGGTVHAAHVRRELGDHAADVLAALDVGGGKADHGRGVAAGPRRR